MKIAITGVACRLPQGIQTLDELWQFLQSGADGIGEIPAGRWDMEQVFHPDRTRPGKIYTRAGAFFDRIDEFDAGYFNISPREAEKVDPQQRLLLELAAEALDDAGLPQGRVAGSRTGVFVGISSTEYYALQSSDLLSTTAYTNSGGMLSIASNRISYHFDLRGPSLSVDTACSSSLVALHLACESLRVGSSELALVGGANLLVGPFPSVGFSKASMLSPTGRCHTFDAAADGYVRTEGGIVLVLKPLDAALVDGDRVLGVIIGSAVNSDGRTTGLSLPSQEAQADLLRHVYAAAGIAPDQVSYVEAHGTGTPAGDPIECRALASVLGGAHRSVGPLPLGSIKSNIGHLEPGSGLAGLMKALLVLRHGRVPANLHFRTPNPAIDFEALNLHVVAESVVLPAQPGPRVVGINSFGFGGTNAHVVVEQAPALIVSAARPAPVVQLAGPLLLSASSPQALAAQASRFASFLDTVPAALWPAVVHTAACHRTHLPHRLVVREHAPDAAARALRRPQQERDPHCAVGHAIPGKPRVALVFSGNGAQWWGMGRRLVADDAIARATVERVGALLLACGGCSLMDVFAADSRAAPELLDRAEVAQPALLALQLATVESLRARGLVFDAVMGHSVGEIPAACVAGALTLEQAVRVVHARSVTQQRTRGAGRMAAVGLGRDACATEIAQVPGWIEIVCINSTRAVTLAGDPRALARLGERLATRNVFFRMLDLDFAFHSRALDAIEDDLAQRLQGLRPAATLVPMVSTVTGDPIDGLRLDADYWWRNVRCPVQFEQGTRSLLASGRTLLLEIGPHPVLASYLQQGLTDSALEGRVLSTLRRDSDEADLLQQTLAQLHLAGAPLDLARWTGGRGFTALPTYAWQRSRYWVDLTRAGASGSAAGPVEHPLLGRRLTCADPTWQNSLDLLAHPFLADHRVAESAVFPGAGYVELMLAAGALTGLGAGLEIDRLQIHKALILSDQPVLVQTVLTSAEGLVNVRSRPEGSDDWTLHASARLVATGTAPDLGQVDLAALQQTLAPAEPAPAFYAASAARGLAYGPAFQTLQSVQLGAGGALACIRPAGAESAGFRLHPAILDGCLQAFIALLPGLPGDDGRSAYLPVSVTRLRVGELARGVAYGLARLAGRAGRSIRLNLLLLDAHGVILGELTGLRARRVDFSAGAAARVGLYDTKLVPIPLPALTDAHGRGAPVPATAALLAAIAPAFADTARALRRDTFYQQVRPRLDRLCAAYAAQGLRGLGCGAGTFTLAELADAGGVVAGHQRLLPVLVEMLTQDGWLETSAGGWRWHPEPPAPDAALLAQQLWQALLQDFPEHLAELMLVARAGENLREVLRGKISPSEVLFGEGTAAPEHFYDLAPFGRVYNTGLCLAAMQVVQALPPGRQLRILEIGAGTGGATASLLSVLPCDRVRYLFTDTSDSFLARAQPRFAACPGVEYRVLDIEADPLTQGFEAGAFDMVIAANVLHATGDLRQVLAHVRSLLCPGGLLALVETQRQRFLDIVFGALDGWWAFRDTALRPHHALLDAERWQTLLAAAGFDGVATLHDAPAGVAPENLLVFARGPADAVAASKPPPPASRRMLVLQQDADPLAASMIHGLRTSGHAVTCVRPASGFAQLSGQAFEVDPARVEDFASVLAAMELGGGIPTDIVFLWGALRAVDPLAVQFLQSMAAGRLATALEAAGAATADTTLTLVTRGAEAVAGTAADPAQAPLRAFGRVLVNEYPALQVRLVDVQPGVGGETLARVLDHLPLDEEIVLTPDACLVTRMRRLPPAAPQAPRGARFVADLRKAGSPDSLFLRELCVTVPGPGTVEVAVRAVGLNFHDMMLVNGMLPDEAVESGFVGAALGMEFAGVVTALGAGVRGFSVGDRVMGFAAGALASHVVTAAGLVAVVPDTLDFEAAATMPSVFATLLYALEQQARLQPGETLLVHSAAGGIGLAAVQVARYLGIEVLATAGNSEKRAFLRRLGVRHVFDSRSLSFADEVLAATGGAGVDAVLNSLAGEAIPRSLTLLKPFGRFIELGKRDFYANSRIGLRPFGDNLSFFGIDVDQLLAARPDATQKMFARLAALVREGTFTPIPYRTFPVTRLAEAFRLMQRAGHIGKIVIAIDGHERALAAAPQGPLVLDGAADYLVTGGLRGFGLATAQMLARRGARHLVLVSRSGAQSQEARDGIAALHAAGVSVVVESADVSNRAQLAGVFARMAEGGRRLGGIVHAAMLLEDGAIRTLDRIRFERALLPKLAGAWNLHQLSLDLSPDFFVLYSSATTCYGNPGQANYVAGNAYLEALAQWRQSQGQPGLAVAWGAIGEVGFLARNADLGAALQQRFGVTPLAPALALETLAQLITERRAVAVVASVDWQAITAQAPFGRFGRFAELKQGARSAPDADARQAMTSQLGTLTPQELVLALREMLVQEVSRILRLAAAAVEVDRPLTDLGMDSLMVVELQTALGAQLKVDVPSMRMINSSLQQLAVLLAGQLVPQGAALARSETSAVAPAQVPSDSPPGAKPTTACHWVDDLSDEEVDRMLSHVSEGVADVRS